jgi:hypothetical protein
VNAPVFVLATLDDAAGPLRRLRAALAASGPATAQPAPLLDVLRQRPGLALHELASAASLPVDDAEAEVRRLARGGLAQASAGDDGIVRWWLAEASP